MNEMEKIEQMFTTLVTEQSVIRGDVKQINERLSDLIRLEQQQINQDAALGRMGAVIDEQKSQIAELNRVITEVRIQSARTMGKIAAISGGSASGVFGIIWAVIQFTTDKAA